MFDVAFWKAAFERAVKTFGQSLLALFVADQPFDVVHFTWTRSLTVAASAAVLSLVTSLVSAKVGSDDSPSLVGEGK